MKNKISNNNYAENKNMSIIKMVCIDIGLLGIFMGIFMYFFYIKPQKLGNGTVITEISSNEEMLFNNSESSDNNNNDNENNNNNNNNNNNSDNNNNNNSNSTTSDNIINSNENKEKKNNSKKGNIGNTGTSSLQSDSEDISNILSYDITSSLIESYSENSNEIKIYKKEFGNNSDKVTYYVADVYVAGISCVKTALAENTYGKNIKEYVSSMADNNNSILAISGDFYGNSEDGVVIRNGVLYRNNTTDADICVLFSDGTIKTYSPSDFNGEQVISEGAWQAWTFGPALLDDSGKILSNFNTTSYLNSENPRCAIGYVEPDHYIFVVVDGREEGYSRGVTLSELAAIMKNEGCVSAYNMDGGGSAAMYYRGEYINQVSGSGRKVSDIVYIK